MSTELFYKGDENSFESFIISKKYSQVFLLADAKTNGFCIPVLKKIIPLLSNSHVIVIPDGEQHKNIAGCELIWQQFIEKKADRYAVMINVGGGMISDIGGMAASLYKRGIDTINIPTTLLSMVDASQGGKTGIDMAGIKNVIGSFHLPVCIYSNPIFFHTLSNRILQSGIAEMIKHALIYDLALWNKMQYYTIEDFTSIENIRTSMSIKNYFVAQDVNDYGIRQALNFGHSMGHAIESNSLETNKPLLHGEAIMLGMEIELALSCIKCQLGESVLKEYILLKKKLFPTLTHSYELNKLLPLLSHDKKNNGTLQMSLISTIGKPSLKINVLFQDILDAYKML
jgi:3-dehydroquinate synthase